MTEPSADKTYGSGRLPAVLANAVSDAIMAAVHNGMGVDEAACVVVAVAADYGRGNYNNEYLASLANVVTERANHALPENGYD